MRSALHQLLDDLLPAVAVVVVLATVAVLLSRCSP
jgi:hypothetical protein